MRLGFVFAVAILSTGAMQSALKAEETQRWSFTGDARPTYVSLITTGPDRTFVGCGNWHNVIYERYAALHPDFRTVMANPDIRKQWRWNLIVHSHGNLELYNGCFYDRLSAPTYDLTSEEKRGKTIFCGVIARNLNARQQRAAEGVAELTEYAMIGRWAATFRALSSEREYSPIRFNADVRYYIQKHMRNIAALVVELKTGFQKYLMQDAGANLSPQRRQFVNAAFERGDYQAVLNTTPACEAHSEK